MALAFDSVFSRYSGRALEKWSDAVEEIDDFPVTSGTRVMDDETERNRNTRNLDVTTGTT